MPALISADKGAITMCGLCGILSDEKKDDDVHSDILIELLHSNALRGMDATGVGGISKTKKGFESILYKRAVAAPEFLQLRGFERNILDNVKNLDVIIGHTRAKTWGDHIDADAHPFLYDKILLAHNGSLSGKGGLKEWDSGVIDSENIALNMSKHPELEVLEALHGAFALTWFNAGDGTFNVARNAARTLALAWETKKNTMYWSSEATMLLSVLARNGVNVETLASIKPGLHFKFKIDDVRKHTVTAFKEYESPKLTVMGQNPQWTGRQPPGLPRTRNGAGTSGEILNFMGLRANERVIVKFASYAEDCKLNNPDHKRGRIFGTIQTGNVALPVVIHNTNKKVYDSVNGGYAICEIKGAYKDMTHGSIAIASFKEASNGIMLPEAAKATKEDQIFWPKTADFRPKGKLLEGMCYGPDNYPVNVERYLMMVDSGCEACGNVIKVSEHDSIFWTEEQTPRPLCRRCVVYHKYPNEDKGAMRT